MAVASKAGVAEGIGAPGKVAVAPRAQGKHSGGVGVVTAAAGKRQRGAYTWVTSSEIRRIAKSTSTTSIMGRTMALPFSVNCAEPI